LTVAQNSELMAEAAAQSERITEQLGRLLAALPESKVLVQASVAIESEKAAGRIENLADKAAKKKAG
jgi:hypothetical protein